MTYPGKVRRLIGRLVKAELVRFYAHPWQIAMAMLFLVVAYGLTAGGHTLPALPTLLVWAWELALYGGGLGLLVAAFWRGPEILGQGIEKGALWLISSVWASCALLVFTGRFESPLLGLQATVICLGAFGRIAALRRSEKVVNVVRAREED